MSHYYFEKETDVQKEKLTSSELVAYRDEFRFTAHKNLAYSFTLIIIYIIACSLFFPLAYNSLVKTLIIGIPLIIGGIFFLLFIMKAEHFYKASASIDYELQKRLDDLENNDNDQYADRELDRRLDSVLENNEDEY